MSTPVRPTATRSYAARSPVVGDWAMTSTSDPHAGVLGCEHEEVVVARPDVGDGPLALRRSAEDGVLLQDVPSRVPTLLEGLDDRGDVDVALAERHIHATGDGFRVRGLVGLHLGGPLETDVLEVHVGDATGMLASHADGVA